MKVGGHNGFMPYMSVANGIAAALSGPSDTAVQADFTPCSAKPAESLHFSQHESGLLHAALSCSAKLLLNGRAEIAVHISYSMLLCFCSCSCKSTPSNITFPFQTHAFMSSMASCRKWMAYGILTLTSSFHQSAKRASPAGDSSALCLTPLWT